MVSTSHNKADPYNIMVSERGVIAERKRFTSFQVKTSLNVHKRKTW